MKSMLTDTLEPVEPQRSRAASPAATLLDESRNILRFVDKEGYRCGAWKRLKDAIVGAERQGS